jgi:hypothetical protein
MTRPALAKARIVPRSTLLGSVVHEAFVRGLANEFGFRACGVPAVAESVDRIGPRHENAGFESPRSSDGNHGRGKIELLHEERSDRKRERSVLRDGDLRSFGDQTSTSGSTFACTPIARS